MSEKPERGESLLRNFEPLSVSKRLVRSVSQKLKRKSHKGEEEERDNARGVSLSCLSLYGRGGGCKVSADMDRDLEDPQARRWSSASDESKGYVAYEESVMNCISHAMREKFWRRSNRKALQLEEVIRNKNVNVFIPDDILEMCLMRLPLVSLMNSRLVCKKWRDLTATPRFWQMRREGSFQSPWLFLFGVVKNGYCSDEIHALDVSLNQWHKLDAEILRGRFLFSVAGVRDDVYIVGGCTSLSNFGKVDKSSYKTHKSVLVFSPLTKSWHKAASMKYARSSPILGIYEVSSDYLIIKNQQIRSERRFHRSRIGSSSDVYEDPHRLSVRLAFRHSLDENEFSFLPSMKSYKFIRQKSGHSNKDNRRFVLIAIGGLGCWDEPLDSGEIYDSVSNKWTEIPRLPVEFGIACSGVVCNRMFYVYSETDKLAAFDIEGGYWIGIHTTLPPRVHEYNPRLISCNDRLLMLSVSWCEGDDQIGRRNKAVRKLWELDLRYHTWIEVSTHPDAPMDWYAAFVSDKTMIFGVEMFKIFGQVLDFLTVCNVSDGETNWRHISRNHVARQLDATSCMTKSVAVLHL
ncbi:PREDICTED: F-box/kelch-repeat protein At5g42350-like [Ipomoea nil]|uniref:F-box/kelch-repeat protein At5g42350-like n=1 Tax=Ipomoea nil TaxID=35883 RepID=UPI000901B286|nr:PREDICTED: F-box/kelch-repeat protein At5g42350-like [Ipomoea nil]XP_019186710.1 PREDICTED: F-box/kelch-repeat protein At5g42350-like [Ipomoea nil]XP_019186711.1 PREDICTED: F-box/kelch-repeat protein At5g42350-like [Ipomoea nil]XP_019186712.1 PREDICTED: F-box/kelch-repeat protein At5g42350-like [Ipomoea nil]XP_019186713.1 PREDICTED: F-box/kelch-repeat protein At5g42350-like [Ipomoea nil]XP_019186714.1 PREDICTED: F-box/kelch-repeat protein At5g42350-like [Ipomoea nil]